MLLSDIGSFLSDLISACKGYAVILENDTGLLVANSIGWDDYSVSNEGPLKRHSIYDTCSREIQM